jgi:hypothetical protein
MTEGGEILRHLSQKYYIFTFWSLEPLEGHPLLECSNYISACDMIYRLGLSL